MGEDLNALTPEKNAPEQYTTKCNVEIHSVPKRSDRNLPELISSISNKIGLSISREDTDIVYRVYTRQPGIKPMIVRFEHS